jgi:DNA-directed RNA polymerase specialized sigma24 family protein
VDVRTLVGTVEGEDPAAALRAVAALRRLTDQLERDTVVRARIAGWSWREIGAALGVSGQAAHKKHRADVP